VGYGALRTYDVAGVTVIFMKLEQSSMREVTSGTFPDRVPVTALAQLSALHPQRTPWAIAKARTKDKSFIIAVSERVCV
jgi:hypothetical protein